VEPRAHLTPVATALVRASSVFRLIVGYFPGSFRVRSESRFEHLALLTEYPREPRAKPYRPPSLPLSSTKKKYLQLESLLACKSAQHQSTLHTGLPVVGLSLSFGLSSVGCGLTSLSSPVSVCPSVCRPSVRQSVCDPWSLDSASFGKTIVLRTLV
jgi:hypothetical protein